MRCVRFVACDRLDVPVGSGCLSVRMCEVPVAVFNMLIGPTNTLNTVQAARFLPFTSTPLGQT